MTETFSEKPIQEPERLEEQQPRGRPKSIARPKSARTLIKEKIETEGAKELLNLLEQLPGDAKIVLMRLDGGRQNYIRTFGSSEFENMSILMDMIKENYGGGSYQLKFLVANKFAGAHSFSIDGPPKRSDPNPIQSVPGAPPIDHLKQIEEENKKLREELEAQKQVAREKALLEQIQTIVKQSSPQPSAWAEVAKTVIPLVLDRIGSGIEKIVDKLNPAEKVSVSDKILELVVKKIDSPGDSIKQMKEALDFMKEVRKEVSESLPQTPTPVQTQHEPSAIDTLISALVPKLIQQPPQATTEPTSTDALAGAPTQEGPRVIPALEQFRNLLRQRVHPHQIVDALEELIPAMAGLGLLNQYPESGRFFQDPLGATRTFLLRFPEISAAGYDGTVYLEKVLAEIEGRLGSQKEDHEPT